jgi:orotidine-5'-phosphate decarboxylase
MGNPVYLALDVPQLDAAKALAEKVRAHVGGFKLGLEFFCAHGHHGVHEIAHVGLPIFLDLKFHDIPNTVAGAVRAVTPLGPYMLNVHAAGGRGMMRAALDAAADTAAKVGVRRPLVIGVTVLTSLGDDDLATIGAPGSAADQVRRLAALAQATGLDGVVCSPQEIELLRRECGRDFMLVTPGIRPAGVAIGDQKRVMTPGEAVRRGADYLVIGRPITAARDPAAAARDIAAEIDRAVA